MTVFRREAVLSRSASSGSASVSHSEYANPRIVPPLAVSRFLIFVNCCRSGGSHSCHNRSPASLGAGVKAGEAAPKGLGLNPGAKTALRLVVWQRWLLTHAASSVARSLGYP